MTQTTAFDNLSSQNDHDTVTTITVQNEHILEQEPNETRCYVVPQNQNVQLETVQNGNLTGIPLTDTHFTVATFDSNPLLVLIRKLSEQATNNIYQVVSSTLSTVNNAATQPQFQTQPSAPRSFYDPPHPPGSSKHTSSLQPGPSTSSATTLYIQNSPQVQVSTTTSQRQTTLNIALYNPAQY